MVSWVMPSLLILTLLMVAQRGGTPSTKVNGATSMVTFVQPPIMAILPMRQNW